MLMHGGDILKSTCAPKPIEGFVTRGRKKRRRRPGSGSAVKVKPHIRTPRGPNAGKPRVKVDGYARGKGAKKNRKKKGTKRSKR